MLSHKTVAIASASRPYAYGNEPPFLPDEPYPELKDRVAVGPERNIVFSLFRELMRELRLDLKSFSTGDWNPLGEIIRPGQKVLIKPNMVRHLHLSGGNYQAVVTHGSLVRSALDYVALALKGSGEITVGDASVQSTDFSKLVERTGLQQICDDVSERWQLPVRLADFRLWSVKLDSSHRIIKSSSLKGDPKGYRSVNLGERSLLKELGGDGSLYRITNYDSGELKKHHNSETHEYLIPKTVLEADVVINLPKLKTHHKVGLTAALKNVVGINGHKDWLPHHRSGSIVEGGDEYKEASLLKRFQTYSTERIDKDPYSSINSLMGLAIRLTDRLIKHFAPDQFLEGSWYGNDTLWRTALDLNRLLVYADRDGRMAATPQRRCLTFVDAIVAGEGQGPMQPDARPCGLLVGGLNPVAVDATLATMIGFDYKKIPLIAKGFDLRDWPLVDFRPGEIEIRSTDDRFKSITIGQPYADLSFKPPSGWLGHIESLVSE